MLQWLRRIRWAPAAALAAVALAASTIVPASAAYESLNHACGSGYGATNKYSTYVASDTVGTSGVCWKWLTARRLSGGSWITYYVNWGYNSSYTASYGASQPGWGTHGLGYDDYDNTWKDTVSG